MTKEQLLEKANDLPLAPGVYLMMDASGKVIYVGKAKKLKNRVSQYFQLGTGHNEKTRRMVSQVDHFDTIFVSSEFEALILENSLIKQHQPHYNILLKDDKGYPFVRLSHGPYPRFTLANKTADDGARYFGPFGARGDPRRHRRGLRRLPPTDLHAPVPARYREGAPLPQLPHGPLRRLLPRRAGRGGISKAHRAGVLAPLGSL